MAKYKCKDPKCPNKKSLNQPGYCPECGGKLVKKSSNAIIYVILGVGVIFILLIVLGAYTAMTTPINYTSTNQDQNQTPVKNEKTNPVFENEYISFKVPEGYEIKDESAFWTVPILISVYENGTKIGSVKLDSTTTLGEINEQNPSSYEKDGKLSYEVFTSDPASVNRWVLFDNYGSTGNMLKIQFDFNKQNVYDEVVDTLKIKKSPS